MSVPLCTSGARWFHSRVHDDAVDEGRVAERGLLTVSDEVWALAVRRALIAAMLMSIVAAWKTLEDAEDWTPGGK